MPNDEYELPVYVTISALALSFAGNFINAIGLIYQKMGHMRMHSSRTRTAIALLTWRLQRDGHLVGMPPRIPRIGEICPRSPRIEEICQDSMLKEESLIAECITASQRSFLSEPLWAFGFGASLCKCSIVDLFFLLCSYILDGLDDACCGAGLRTTGESRLYFRLAFWWVHAHTIGVRPSQRCTHPTGQHGGCLIMKWSRAHGVKVTTHNCIVHRAHEV